MTTYYQDPRAKERSRELADPFLDLTKQILVPRSEFAEDVDDELRVREVLLSATSGTPFWGNDPSAYNYVTFAKNIVLPGRCSISGKGFEQRVRRDKPPGRHGHSLKQLGIQPAKVDIDITMWTEEHLEAFKKLVPILLSQKYKTEVVSEAAGFTGNANGAGFSGVAAPAKTKQVAAGPKALDIYHPWLALFRIRTVHILSVGIPTARSEPDVWDCRIECEQFIYKPVAVKAASESTEKITEATMGPTAATIAMEEKRTPKKPSTQFGGGSFRGSGASGSF